MRPVIEGWSIVMAGDWNPAIFSPGWVAGRLTPSKEVGIEFAIEQPIQPPRLSFDGIFLRLAERRLVLAPSTPEDLLLQRAQEVACNILNTLPHTPISAVGVNFQFLEPEPTGVLADLFDLRDTGALSDTGFRLRATSVKRALEHYDHLLNLTLSFLENSTVLIDFNFHRDVKDADGARAVLEAGALRLKELAFEVLASVYDAHPA